MIRTTQPDGPMLPVGEVAWAGCLNGKPAVATFFQNVVHVWSYDQQWEFQERLTLSELLKLQSAAIEEAVVRQENNE